MDKNQLFLQFEHLRALCEKPEKIAVAVSGGSDSMAALLLTREWAEKSGVSILALTVDHGLRAEAAEEARTVKQWTQALSIEHHILKWQGPYPQNGIQQAARDARYQLLLEECERLGASALILGHQQEDQLETFLMRLSKGSSLQGLGVMKPVRQQKGIFLLRPFLKISRKELRGYLRQKKQAWIDDPSNINPDFTRTRLGAVLKQLTDLPGADMAALEKSVFRLQRADQALHEATQEFLGKAVTLSPLGYATVCVENLLSVSDEIAIRALQQMFLYARPGAKRPMLSQLEDIHLRLKETKTIATTAFNCQLLVRKGRLYICAEKGRGGFPKSVWVEDACIMWDKRFLITDHELGKKTDKQRQFSVEILGKSGVDQLIEAGAFEDDFTLPSVILRNLPGIWFGEELASMPLFSYNSKTIGIARGRFEMVFSPKGCLL